MLLPGPFFYYYYFSLNHHTTEMTLSPYPFSQTTVRKSVCSMRCVWWNSWAPAAPATPSSAMPLTGPCAARTAARTPTTACDERPSAWPRPSSPSSTRGPAVSGITRMRAWKQLLLCPSKIVVFRSATPTSNPLLCSLSLLQGNVISFLFFAAFSCFQAVGMSVLDLKCIWSRSKMHSEWMCGGGGGVGGCGASQSNRARVPSLEKLCLYFSTRSLTIHILIPVMLRPVTKHCPHVSFIPPRLLLASSCCSTLSFSVCLMCCCIPVLKKELFFLVAVLQSVCLSVFVRLAILLAVWLQVEKWGHSVGNLPRWIPDGWSSAPPRHDDLTGGVMHRCLYPLASSVSVYLLVPSICSPFYPPARLWSLRLEKSFLFPFPFVFWLLFRPQRPFILLLACLWFFRVYAKAACQLPTQPPPKLPHKSCTMNAQTIISLQLCGSDDTLGSACNSILLNVLANLACLHFRTFNLDYPV